MCQVKGGQTSSKEPFILTGLTHYLEAFQVRFLCGCRSRGGRGGGGGGGKRVRQR